jgi:hypothetical protein
MHPFKEYPAKAGWTLPDRKYDNQQAYVLQAFLISSILA